MLFSYLMSFSSSKQEKQLEKYNKEEWDRIEKKLNKE